EEKELLLTHGVYLLSGWVGGVAGSAPVYGRSRATGVGVAGAAAGLTGPCGFGRVVSIRRASPARHAAPRRGLPPLRRPRSGATRPRVALSFRAGGVNAAALRRAAGRCRHGARFVP